MAPRGRSFLAASIIRFGGALGQSTEGAYVAYGHKAVVELRRVVMSAAAKELFSTEDPV
jgi:hypothetical protein